MIHFFCWKWSSSTYRHKYTAEHVNILAASIGRNYRKPHRVVCITDDPTGIECETFPIWGDHDTVRNPSGPHFPSCYRRLKLFSTEQLYELGVGLDERVASIDLDVVIVNRLEKLVDRHEEFLGWRGKGTHHPVVYNGSMWMFRAGKMERLWSEFDPILSPIMTKRMKFFGSDQAWLSYSLRGKAAGWDFPTIMSFHKDLQKRNHPGPLDGTSIVSFNGHWKPWDEQSQQHSPWIKQHWRS